MWSMLVARSRRFSVTVFSLAIFLTPALCFSAGPSHSYPASALSSPIYYIGNLEMSSGPHIQRAYELADGVQRHEPASYKCDEMEDELIVLRGYYSALKGIEGLVRMMAENLSLQDSIVTDMALSTIYLPEAADTPSSAADQVGASPDWQAVQRMYDNFMSDLSAAINALEQMYSRYCH